MSLPSTRIQESANLEGGINFDVVSDRNNTHSRIIIDLLGVTNIAQMAAQVPNSVHFQKISYWLHFIIDSMHPIDEVILCMLFWVWSRATILMVRLKTPFFVNEASQFQWVLDDVEFDVFEKVIEMQCLVQNHTQILHVLQEIFFLSE